jgi:hypothetical protein
MPALHAILLYCAGLLLSGLQPAAAQRPPVAAPGPPAANVVGVGGNWIGEPAVSLQYMRRLGTGRFGLGGDLGMRGLIPQAQLRFEHLQSGPSGTGVIARFSWHGSIGVLLTPGGFDYAGAPVEGGTGLMAAFGNQLWPDRGAVLPLFLDLSLGVILPQAGMAGMPDIAQFIRAYVGFGW